MQLRDYLVKKESITVKVDAYDSPDAVSSSAEGTLACTPYRLVYVRDDEVKDISITQVSSIEYSGPSYPDSYISWGSAGIAVGVLLFFVGEITVSSVIGDLGLAETVSEIGLVLGVLGLISVVIAYFLRREQLKVYTANKTYEFSSTDGDLAEVAHAIRGHEMERVNG